jgi:hypothetical protein
MLGDLFVSVTLCRGIAPDMVNITGASMSLVGLLPPLSDNGNMLVDGGYSEFSVPVF